VMQRWLDGNGSNSFFPAAVRIGYDPEIILREMRRYAEHTVPNGFQLSNPHGIENLSTVPNTINEMLCMGHKGVLRLFPVWPKDKDATFTRIRCWGAFLVSGELKNGRVEDVRLLSEKGRDCTMVNPWPGEKVGLYSGHDLLKTLDGARFTFKTSAGASYQIKAL
jgi:alpha-L-fucosidase 2